MTRKILYWKQGDIILIGLREFQDDKADVIHKYYPEEARELKKKGELPASARINETGAVAGGSEMAGDAGAEGAFEFDEGGEEEEDGAGEGGGEVDIDAL